jgi:hypothetical protein
LRRPQFYFRAKIALTLKKPCPGFYVSQNILPTSFEIDQIQNIIDILVIDCLIFRSGIAENARLLYGVFMLKSVPNLGRARNFFSDKIHQRRKINDQGRGIKAKRHTPMEYDDLH